MLNTIPTPITITTQNEEAQIHFIPSETYGGYHLGYITSNSITLISDERDTPLHFSTIYEATQWVGNNI